MPSPISEVIDELRKTSLLDTLHAVQTDHRTNQQLLAHVIFAIVTQWATNYSDGNYDLRNAATCSHAYNMINALKEYNKKNNNEEELQLPYI